MTDAQRIEKWFQDLPAGWKERAQQVRELLLDAAPGMQEKWLFKSTPFYYHLGWMCFLSFARDKRKYPDGPQLVLGFCAGIRMLDPEHLFVPTEHALIRHYHVPLPDHRFNQAALRRLLDEAVHLNEVLAEERRLKKSAPMRARVR